MEDIRIGFVTCAHHLFRRILILRFIKNPDYHVLDRNKRTCFYITLYSNFTLCKILKMKALTSVFSIYSCMHVYKIIVQ
jgi:hypothetical protein